MATAPTTAAATRPVLADGVLWPEDAVEVGRVLDAWGVKGGIKVQPFSSDPQALFCTKKWFLMPAEPAGIGKPAAKVAAKTAVKVAKSTAATTPAPALKRLDAPRFLQVKQAREQGDVVVVTSDDLLDRNAAEALKGARVFVSRSAFPTPDTGEFYWIDLIGLDVVNRDGQALGKVVDLMETGPTSVLRCELPAATPGAAATECLIPFVSAYIDSVSLAERRIVADWGLDY